MTSNVEIPSSGYDVQVVGDFPPQLNCGICMFIMKNSMHGCTQHVFCRGCIIKYIECGIRIDGNVMCPGGCGKVIDSSKLEANEFADRMINCLTTKCSNDGCNWQGDLLDLVQVHQLNCEYILQSCANNGCNEKYLKKDLLQHNEVCLYKLIECVYCHTDIIRINKEKHEAECLNEKVKCIYYDIGCKKELCRRDLPSHEQTHHTEHTRLIFISLTNCKKELLMSNNEIKVLKQEVVEFKQENALLKEKIVVLTNDTLHFKQQVINSTTELQELKKENRKLIEKSKHIDMDASSGIAVATNEPVHMKVKVEGNNVDCLKKKLRNAHSLRGKVFLINDDEVMIIKLKNPILGFNSKYLSDCYKENKFKNLFYQFDLKDEKSLMMELLNKVPYHMYEYMDDSRQCYHFVFPLDLQNIKDIEVVIPDKFEIKILDNEFIVETLSRPFKESYVLIEKYAMQVQHQKKFDLRRLGGCTRLATPFAPGYAFLRIRI